MVSKTRNIRGHRDSCSDCSPYDCAYALQQICSIAAFINAASSKRAMIEPPYEAAVRSRAWITSGWSAIRK